MRQYPVPQFIEREAKITFFLTFRQFIYLIVVGFLGYLLYKIFPFFLFLIIFFPTGGLILASAFIKINGRSFLSWFKDYLDFLKGGKKYVWKKEKVSYPRKLLKEKETKIRKESELERKKIKVETSQWQS